MESDDLKFTPSWAVASVCALFITIALLIERGLHLLTVHFERRRRRTLFQALYHIKTELRNLGFMSLLLSIARQPISKICIPGRWSNTFVPCKRHNAQFFDEDSACPNGKASLVSTIGSGQLQLLIFVLVIFHVLTCLLTFVLGDAKLDKYKSWEEETKTMEFQLTNDSRRFKLTRKTLFGKRHLKLWSDHPLLLWLVSCFGTKFTPKYFDSTNRLKIIFSQVCSFRQFMKPVSRADYYALRRGFLTVHFHKDFDFNFQKFLSRSLDHDFAVVVRISIWIWVYAIIMILLSASELSNSFWPPFIPLVILLIVGMKLEVIITTMCLKGSQETVIVPGTVPVTPDNSLFWFGRPKFLLHLIQFALVQNTVHIAYFTWSWYSFGFHSCFHKNNGDIACIIVVGLLVQFLCAYVTLPLYALVAQMGSSMRESIFTERILEGVKNWQKTAKRNIEEAKSDITSTPSLSSSSSYKGNSSSNTSKRIVQDLTSPRNTSNRTIRDFTNTKLVPLRSDKEKMKSVVSPSSPPIKPIPFLSNGGSPSSSRIFAQDFTFPSGRQELLEVQKVVEEIMQYGSPNSSAYVGDVSFRLWKKQSK